MPRRRASHTAVQPRRKARRETNRPVRNAVKAPARAGDSVLFSRVYWPQPESATFTVGALLALLVIVRDPA